MAMSDVQPSSFEFYEGIRILIPGAAVVAAYAAVEKTFELPLPSPSDNAFEAIIASLLIGLVLYFMDLPNKSQVYKAALPHRVLETWSDDERGGASAMNLYFILLDDRLPAGIRSRALYMGSIFRIGFEAIYLLVLTAVPVQLALAMGVGHGSADRTGVEPVLWVACGLHVLVPGAMVVFAAARKRKLRDRDHLGPLATLVPATGVVASLAAAGALIAGLPDVVVVAAIGAAVAVWAIVYLVGWPSAKGRRNLSAVAAAVLLAGPTAATSAFGATHVEAIGAVGVAGVAGWSAASLAALLLVATRGHEKKWWGAYYTQRAWMSVYEAPLKERYKAPQF